jgi:Glycine rich protein
VANETHRGRLRFLGDLVEFPTLKTKGPLLSAAVSAVVFAAGLLFSIGGTAGATNSACVTTGSYTACQTFLEIGSDQSFAVPAGVTALHAELWGAGGGGPNPNGYWAYQAGGGGGGYATADIAVSPGEVFKIVVGQGGQMNSDSSTYGGGGAGAGGFSGYAPAVGGSGGGMSAIFHATAPLLVAGGGGGASPGAEDATSTVAGGGGERKAGMAPTPTFLVKVVPSQRVERRRSIREMLLTVLARFPLTRVSPNQVRNTKAEVAAEIQAEPKVAAAEVAAAEVAATLAVAVEPAKAHRRQDKTVMAVVVLDLSH